MHLPDKCVNRHLRVRRCRCKRACARQAGTVLAGTARLALNGWCTLQGTAYMFMHAHLCKQSLLLLQHKPPAHTLIQAACEHVTCVKSVPTKADGRAGRMGAQSAAHMRVCWHTASAINSAYGRRRSAARSQLFSHKATRPHSVGLCV
jgi:hypothetical protein